jgi:hypothetical protein
MQLEFTACGRKVARQLDVPLLKLGGSQRDDVFIAGLEPAAVRIRKRQGQVWVSSQKPARLNGVEMAAHAAFRVLPGERVSWAEGSIQLAIGQARIAPVTATRIEEASSVSPVTVAEPASKSDSVTTAAATRVLRPWGTLTCLNGAHAGRVIPLTRAELIVGRGADAQAKVDDSAVSKHQARMRWNGELASLECLSRTNATLHNGKKLKGPARLDSGAVLTLGHSLLRFELTGARVSNPFSEAPTPLTLTRRIRGPRQSLTLHHQHGFLIRVRRGLGWLKWWFFG